MTEPTTIPKLSAGDVASRFAELRRLGLDLLAEMTGGEWTNFNEGDPGVTLLEELCYALTDLAYRTSQPLADLLADRDGRVPLDRLLLYPPSQILPSNPITENDYRRLLLDRFEDLLDARLRPDPGAPAGSYRVEIEPAPSLGVKERAELGDAVKAELNRYRNLCEMFSPVEFCQPRQLSFDAEIVLRDGADSEETGYAILRGLYESLSPPLRFRSLAELQDAGVPLDAAFTGPLLENGFLLDQDLPRGVPVSDVHALVAATILATPGVADLAVGPTLRIDGRSLTAHDALDGDPPIRFHLTRAVTQTDLPDLSETCSLRFVKPGPAAPFELASAMLRHLQDTAPTRRYPVSQGEPEEVRGHPFDAETYHSIQNGLPRIYRLGANALGDSAPAARRAQARQLKGYLLTFEQLLANYLAQLAHLGDLFSAVPQERTYFFQPLYSVPEVAPLLEGFPAEAAAKEPRRYPELWRDFTQNRDNAYLRGLARATEDRLLFMDRRTRFLDHLLARFGEGFPTESRLTYETIANKEQYLSAYPELGRARANAFDYARAPGTPGRRDQATLVRKLDILLRKGAAGPPSPVTADIYLVETILLAPSTGTDGATPASASVEPPPRSPYEFQAVYVMTNWTAADLTPDFQAYVRQMIDRGSPAHIRNVVLWLESDQMTDFREVYHAWEKELADGPAGADSGPAQRLLAILRQHWPPGDKGRP